MLVLVHEVQEDHGEDHSRKAVDRAGVGKCVPGDMADGRRPAVNGRK